MYFIVLIIGAYLLGSVPFGFIIAKMHGKDLRAIGSGNIGATNLSRALGKKWGYLCFLLDVLKALIPTMLAGRLISTPPAVAELFLWLAVGCSAVVGHVFSIYLKFRGGKGVASSFGIALGIWPYYTIAAIISIGLWVMIMLIWRYISLASVITAVAFPVILAVLVIIKGNWEITTLWPLFIIAIAIAIMVVIRHRENIKKLLNGTENKIGTRSITGLRS